MHILRSFTAALVFGASALGLCLSASAAGATLHPEPPERGWPFVGPLGKLDQKSVARGYQVYREVCASCHSMSLLSYRNLGEKGGPFYDPLYPNANDNPLVKQFAAQDEVLDTVPDASGDYDYRPARASDPFRSPYPNEQAARAASGGAYPPDLSVITKARGHGTDGSGASYVYRLLMGYPDPKTIGTRPGPDGQPEKFLTFKHGEMEGVLTQQPGQYYNPYMAGDTSAQWSGDPRHKPPGGFLAMGQQLTPDRVSYMDGTKATTEQMAYDVAQFLQWAGDPKQTARKSLGLPVVIYLVLLAILLWFSYRQIWRKVGH